LYTLLPGNIQNLVKFVPPCLHNDVPDRITWVDHLDGIHTARSGYSWLLSSYYEDLVNNDVSWNWILKIYALKKIKLLFWTASHVLLPAKALLHRCSMTMSPLCHKCNYHVEDVLHCFTDCTLSAYIWRSLGYSGTSFLSELRTHSWLKKALRLSGPLIFVASNWCIWKAQNAECLGIEKVSYDQSRHNVGSYISSLSTSLGGCLLSRPQQRCTSWHPSCMQPTILNVDWSNFGNSDRTCFGGVMG